MNPERVLADLRALEELTFGHRVAWTREWRRGRGWLRERLAELPGVEVTEDVAGNLWATLPGTSPEFVLVGSHIDTVPDGGWLDGSLGVLAGVEMLRSRAGGEPGPVGLRLVDFADEEGASFGRSLVGSTAAAGQLEVDADSGLARAARECGYDLTRANEARAQLDGALAYIELHIEQGPVLELEGISVSAVDGCAGVERHRVTITGKAAHAGAAPMRTRRDAFLAAAKGTVALALFAQERGGTSTVGQVKLEPGVPTIVPGAVQLLVDLRHPTSDGLADLLDAAHNAFDGDWEPVWRIDPVPFDPDLVAVARDVCGGEQMGSGALHDAAALAPVVPTVMLFVPSVDGVSHSRAEDTDDEDIVAGVRALDELLSRVMRSRG